MKRWSVIGLLLLGVTTPAAAEEIVIAADSWCPYNCEPGSEKPGYMVEIAARAFESAGHKVTYRTMPWARALSDAMAGKIVGVFGASQDEAPDMIYPKQAMALSRNVMAVPIASPFAWTSVKSLESLALGVIQDYSYGDTLDEYIKTNAANPARIQKLSGDTPLQGNLRKLMAGRIGATVDDVNVLAYEIADEKLTDAVRIVDLPDTPTPLYIGLSPKLPKSAEYAALLDSTILSLRKSGELANILGRYGLRDWERPSS